MIAFNHITGYSNEVDNLPRISMMKCCTSMQENSVVMMTFLSQCQNQNHEAREGVVGFMFVRTSTVWYCLIYLDTENYKSVGHQFFRIKYYLVLTIMDNYSDYVSELDSFKHLLPPLLPPKMPLTLVLKQIPDVHPFLMRTSHASTILGSELMTRESLHHRTSPLPTRIVVLMPQTISTKDRGGISMALPKGLCSPPSSKRLDSFPAIHPRLLSNSAIDQDCAMLAIESFCA